MANSCPIYVGEWVWTSMDGNARKSRNIGPFLKQPWTPLDMGAAGAGRQDPRPRSDRIGALLGAPGRAEHGGGRLSGGEYRPLERRIRFGQHAACDRAQARYGGAARAGRWRGP